MSSGPASDASNPVITRAEARLGQMLRGKWRLDRLLGVGGMAAVYVGVHRNGMRGAVKMMHVETGLNEDSRARFLREGYAANRVDHPGAVRVLDDDVAEDGSAFLVMDLLEGETLEARAAARPDFRLEMNEVLGFADELLDVLAAAHDKGIVHRDIKPENLFLTRRGELKVLDFGIARMREGADSARMTTTGAALGTPAFMPPEQALGNWDQVDARTDLWAAGATMFTLLTGRYVHDADTIQKMMLAAMTLPAPRLGLVRPDLPPELGQIIDGALAFDQAQRWPDARAMQHAVRALRARQGEGPMRAPPASLPEIAPKASSPHLPLFVATTGTQVMVAPPARASAPGFAEARNAGGVIASSGYSAVAAAPRRGKAPMIGALVGLGAVLVGLVLWVSLRGDHASVTPSASIEAPAPPMDSASASAVVVAPSPAPIVTAEPTASASASSLAPPAQPSVGAPEKRLPEGKVPVRVRPVADPFARQH
jgi:serine/threonine protein kinase